MCLCYLIPCSSNVNHCRISPYRLCWDLRHLQVNISAAVSHLYLTSTLRAFLLQRWQSKGMGISPSQVCYSESKMSVLWFFTWAGQLLAPHTGRAITSKGLQQHQGLPSHRVRHISLLSWATSSISSFPSALCRWLLHTQVVKDSSQGTKAVELHCLTSILKAFVLFSLFLCAWDSSQKGNTGIIFYGTCHSTYVLK